MRLALPRSRTQARLPLLAHRRHFVGRASGRARRENQLARAVLICGRHAAAVADLEATWRLIARRLTPDNIEVPTPTVGRESGAVSVVFDPSGAVHSAGASVCIGVTGPRARDWLRPETEVPEGSFALWRVDAERVELVADELASRTIWYAHTDELFIASTSQRAIAMLLGEYRPNGDAVSWMLSAGTLGPTGGWDARLHAVGPGARVVLERGSWRVREARATFEFAAAGRSGSRSPRLELADAVTDAVADLSLDTSRWVLPLSGGVDCRGLLLAMLTRARAPETVRCVTWGRPASLAEPGNDGYVARLLAERTGVSHRFLPTELTGTLPLERLLERFLVAGEGRVAHISGYLDGFALWKTLREEGVEGIVRGDQVFGRPAVINAADSRRLTSLMTLEDYFEPRERAALELPAQAIPPSLRREPGESLATWRDRLCQHYTVPVLLAGLTDLKTAYVEVANPLLAARVVRHARTLTDAERSNKRLWRQTVRDWLPGIEFAKHAAIVPLGTFLATPAMLEHMADTLSAARAVDRLGSGVVRRCRAGIDAALLAGSGSPGRPDSPAVRALRYARRRLGFERPTLDPLVFAFRACVVTWMADLLEQDAAALAAAAGPRAAVGGRSG